MGPPRKNTSFAERYPLRKPLAAGQERAAAPASGGRKRHSSDLFASDISFHIAVPKSMMCSCWQGLQR